MSPLRVAGLRKSYDGREVVAGLDFELPRGECYGLLGPNGAGKTTTLRCCLGLTAPDSGTIRPGGRTGAGARPRSAHARSAWYRSSTISIPISPPPRTSSSMAATSACGMRDPPENRRTARLRRPGRQGDANIRTLSGGMKRRLTLARALVNDPELLLLDEPTTGLDPQARHLIWERLKRLQTQGKTILLTTHFMDEAERLCQRLAIIDAGRMVAEGPPRDLIRQHIEAQVVEVYGEDAPGWAEREAGNFSRASKSAARPPSAMSRTPHRCSPTSPTGPRCAPCTGRPTWRTCSSNLPGGNCATRLHLFPAGLNCRTGNPWHPAGALRPCRSFRGPVDARLPRC
jgi:lipooligosaccharide transport system ATP-binding protein